MVKKPANVPSDSEWIIQRYLSNPHLFQGRKYILRYYVLITSVESLRFISIKMALPNYRPKTNQPMI